MGFFQYAEKVSCMVGLDAVLQFIWMVHACWESDKTVGECSEVVIKQFRLFHSGKTA